MTLIKSYLKTLFPLSMAAFSSSAAVRILSSSTEHLDGHDQLGVRAFIFVVHVRFLSLSYPKKSSRPIWTRRMAVA
jgi:hypothetical protein